MKTKLEINRPIIYWILLLFVPIEAISGITANFAIGTINFIGYSYRGIIIAYCSRKFLKKRYIVFSLTTVVVFLGIIYNGLLRPYGSLSNDIMMFVRLLYFETLCLGVADDALTGRLNSECIESIFNKSSCFMIIVYAISLITGRGLTSYLDGNSGYKALFNSVNSLTCVLIVLSGFQLFVFLRDNKLKHAFLYLTLTMFLFLLGSKSGIVFWAIYLLFSLRPRLSKKYAQKIIGVIVLVLIGMCVILNRFSNQIMVIIARFAYFQKTSDSTLQFLLSGRSSLLRSAWTVFKDNLNIFDVLFGKGASNMQILIGRVSAWGITKNVEMDLFDIFFFYGILGLAITYGLTFFLYRRKLKQSVNGKEILFWICILFSILGGHIYMDSFGSSILSLVVALNLSKNSPNSIILERFEGKG